MIKLYAIAPPKKLNNPPSFYGIHVGKIQLGGFSGAYLSHDPQELQQLVKKLKIPGEVVKLEISIKRKSKRK